MKRVILCAVVVFLSVTGYSQSDISARLKEGDIVFQKIPCGDLCDAIIETTPCKEGRVFNHCGIVHFEKNRPHVIEAIGEKVKMSPLEDFLNRDNGPTLYYARLKPEYASFVEIAVKKAIVQVGAPYDNAYLPGDDALYCSELIHDVFKTNDSPHLFPFEPMTFKSKSGKTFPAWAKYYKDLKMEIPEGQPGINPCAIANSDVLTLMECAR
jgi:hypothetical protein